MTDELWKGMAQAVRTQENFCTAEPIFVVQQRRRIYGIDEAYCEAKEIVWLDEEGCELSFDEAEALEVAYQQNGVVPEMNHRVGYRDTWEFVQPFVTHSGAEAYIQANSHRMNEARIYVDSGHRNPEWKEVRRQLKEESHE